MKNLTIIQLKFIFPQTQFNQILLIMTKKLLFLFFSFYIEKRVKLYNINLMNIHLNAYIFHFLVVKIHLSK